MISLESGKKYGGFCVYIRTWNGIDQPDYYPVMKIIEEEVGFKAGRFKRCLGHAKAGKAGYDLYLVIQQPADELEPLVNWVDKNTEGQWELDIEDTFISPCWRFSFTNDEDAVLFKLTWNAVSSKDGAIE